MDSLDTSKIIEWEINDAKIMTLILRFVDQHYFLNLRPYQTTKGMWNYLKKIYNKDNAARKYQLEFDISEYRQGNKSIQEFYSSFMELQTGFKDLVYATTFEE